MFVFSMLLCIQAYCFSQKTYISTYDLTKLNTLNMNAIKYATIHTNTKLFGIPVTSQHGCLVLFIEAYVGIAHVDSTILIQTHGKTWYFSCQQQVLMHDVCVCCDHCCAYCDDPWPRWMRKSRPPAALGWLNPFNIVSVRDSSPFTFPFYSLIPAVLMPLARSPPSHVVRLTAVLPLEVMIP